MLRRRLHALRERVHLLLLLGLQLLLELAEPALPELVGVGPPEVETGAEQHEAAGGEPEEVGEGAVEGAHSAPPARTLVGEAPHRTPAIPDCAGLWQALILRRGDVCRRDAGCGKKKIMMLPCPSAHRSADAPSRARRPALSRQLPRGARLRISAARCRARPGTRSTPAARCCRRPSRT